MTCSVHRDGDGDGEESRGGTKVCIYPGVCYNGGSSG